MALPTLRCRRRTGQRRLTISASEWCSSKLGRRHLAALPFPDGSFDAAFAHAVLMHLREPVQALGELRRILRPGGIAGVRDPDAGGNLRIPTTPLLEQWSAVAERVRQHNGRLYYWQENG